MRKLQIAENNQLLLFTVEVMNEIIDRDRQRQREYRAYLKSPEWKHKKAWLLYSRGPCCESCGRLTDLEIHHKNYNNLFNEMPADLEILCIQCHKERHNLTVPVMAEAA